ncbi:hypothetical protein [Falsiporphyromonas endometrii]|uniref:Uncharacterized protein n=1 Tax=Falsiporphyromonas endometrii TaxID=1387297 RepID=A0ABV9KAH3_9PORP
MEITILLTILLIIISLGRLFFQEGKICPIGWKLTSLHNCLSHRTEKLIMRKLYLLNIVTFSFTQKAAQTTLIQLKNLKFEG